MLDENGSPQIVERAKIVRRSQVGAISADPAEGDYRFIYHRRSLRESYRSGNRPTKNSGESRAESANRRHHLWLLSPSLEGEKPSILLGSRHRHSCIPTNDRTTRRTLRFTGDFNGKKCDARGQQLNWPANRSRNSGRNSRRQRPPKIVVGACAKRLAWRWIQCLAQAPLQQTQSPDTFCAPGD